MGGVLDSWEHDRVARGLRSVQVEEGEIILSEVADLLERLLPLAFVSIVPIPISLSFPATRLVVTLLICSKSLRWLLNEGLIANFKI